MRTSYRIVFYGIVILFSLVIYPSVHDVFAEKDILSPEERTWLDENASRVVLAVETNYQPYVFLDDDGELSGIAHEYMLLIEKKLGVHFRERRFSSLDDIFNKAMNHEVQIVNAVTETPWRSTFLDFTKPYIRVPNVMVVRKERTGKIDEHDLKGLKVSLVKNYAVTEHVMKKNLGFAADLVTDDLMALLNVSFGRSDVAIIDLASASFLISQKNITNLRVAGQSDQDIVLAIGTPKNQKILHGILKKGIASISEDERNEIVGRWVNPSNGIIFTDWRFWALTTGVLASIFFLIACFFVWNLILRKQVSVRTTALISKTESLRKSEESLMRAVKAGRVGLWVWELKTGTVYFSPEWKQQLGYNDDEIEGRYEAWEQRLHPDDREKALAVLNTSLNPPWPPYHQEYRLRHKDGSYRWILATGDLTFAEGTEPVRLMGTHVDITELKMAQEQKAELESKLVQSRNMESVGRLAGGIAHDFNNMLGVIIGNTEMAKDKVPPFHSILEDLDEIYKAAERLADLTRKLLAFARQQTVCPIVLNINERVSDMVKILMGLTGEHVAVEWSPRFDVWPVKIDPYQLDQILTQLFVNAKDAIDDKGTISIHTDNLTADDRFCLDYPDSEPGDYVRITVGDTGRGIDEETLALIFEPFYSSKGFRAGTGLGLSAVYGSVKQNNGFITVESRVGEGSKFAVHLPRYVAMNASQD